MKNLRTAIGGAILTLAIIFGVSVAAGSTAQAQNRSDHDAQRQRRDRDNDNTGDYVLGIVFATPKCTVIPLSCGEVVTNEFTRLVQQHTYSLYAVAGDLVRLTSLGTSGGVCPDVDVFDSAGTLVGGIVCEVGVTTLKVTQTATYTLLVRDHDNDNTGAYEVDAELALATSSAFLVELFKSQLRDVAGLQTFAFFARHFLSCDGVYFPARMRAPNIGSCFLKRW